MRFVHFFLSNYLSLSYSQFVWLLYMYYILFCQLDGRYCLPICHLPFNLYTLKMVKISDFFPQRSCSQGHRRPFLSQDHSHALLHDQPANICVCFSSRSLIHLEFIFESGVRQELMLLLSEWTTSGSSVETWLFLLEAQVLKRENTFVPHCFWMQLKRKMHWGIMTFPTRPRSTRPHPQKYRPRGASTLHATNTG